jgi:hypothetical protein
MRMNLLIVLGCALWAVAGSAPHAATPSGAPIGGDSTAIAPSDSVLLPKPIDKVEPVYPNDAAKRGIEGTVYLFVLVDEEGYPVKATVDTTRTFFSHPGEHKTAKYEAELTLSAQDAVMQWKFKPGTIKGVPTDMGVVVPIQFQLADMHSGALGTPTIYTKPTPTDRPPFRDTNADLKPIKDGEPDKK